MLGPPPSGDSHSNRAGTTNQSQVIGDLVANSHAISSPAKLPPSGTNAVVNNQIPTEVSNCNTFVNVGNQRAAAVGVSSQLTSNSTHDPTAPVSQPTVEAPVSTWSKFAQQTGPSQAIESTKTLDSFQQFKKQAKEKQDKEKLIEKQEQMRREREMLQEREEREERERIAQRIDQEGEIALNSLQRSEQSPVLSPASDSQSPASGAGTSGGGGGSNIMKLREQERRKREALASQNQMDLSRQSEIMSKFEDRV